MTKTTDFRNGSTSGDLKLKLSAVPAVVEQEIIVSQDKEKGSVIVTFKKRFTIF